MKFETDYGVDLGLLLDAGMSGARLAEVDIGHLEHESQSLDALGQMAKQVVRTLITRAYRYGRLSIDQVREVEEVERHMNAEFFAHARHHRHSAAHRPVRHGWNTHPRTLC